jgi:hypothetical protein
MANHFYQNIQVNNIGVQNVFMLNIQQPGVQEPLQLPRNTVAVYTGPGQEPLHGVWIDRKDTRAFVFLLGEHVGMGLMVHCACRASRFPQQWQQLS